MTSPVLNDCFMRCGICNLKLSPRRECLSEQRILSKSARKTVEPPIPIVEPFELEGGLHINQIISGFEACAEFRNL